jgi:hypothetical protein
VVKEVLVPHGLIAVNIRHEVLRENDSFGAISCVQLPHNMPDVNLHSVFGKIEVMGNPFIGAAPLQSGQNF